MSRYLDWKKQALLMGAGQWYLPPTVSAADLLAAYQFKGVASENFAKQDLSGNGRNLTKGSQEYNGTSHTPTWSMSSGYTFDAVYQGKSGYLDNAQLDTLDIKAAVVRYSGLTQNNRGYLINAGGSSGNARLYAATSAAVYSSYSDGSYTGSVSNWGGPGFASSAWSSYTWVGTIKYTTTFKQNCIVGANFSDSQALYLDGSLATTTTSSSGKTFTDIGQGDTRGYTFSDQHRTWADLGNDTHAGKTLVAAVFFSKALTADEHAYIAARMANI